MEPSVEINDDVEEEFNCKLCDMSFWYQNELNDHLKNKHGIADPIKHEREEKQKRLAELQKKKQQQQQAMSAMKRPGLPNGMRPPVPKPSMHTRSLASSILQSRGNDMLRRFNDRSSSLKNINGIRRPLIPGRIPPRIGGASKLRTKGSNGYQFRDGVFICINCGKDFNDGPAMVKHSYCKQDKAKYKKNEKKREEERRKAEKKERKRSKKERRAKRRSRRSGSVSTIESDSDEIVDASDDDTASDKEVIVPEPKKEKKKGYWTAYLLWSTRKRKEINKEDPDMSFSEVSKAISEGWKEVTEEETRRLKEEADELNANNIRKLPASKGGGQSDESENSEEEDPSFDETHLKKVVTKEIEHKEPVRRSSRNKKNADFYQEVAEKEEKFDELLDYNEEKQIKESLDENGEPRKRIKKEPKREDDAGPSSSTRRKYRKKIQPREVKQEVELETTRSGRVRKKAKKLDLYYPKDSENSDNSDNPEDDDFEVKEEDANKDDEKSSTSSSEEDKSDDDDSKKGSDLEDRPLRSLKTSKGKENKKSKKRGRPSKKRESTEDYRPPRANKGGKGKRGKYNKSRSKEPEPEYTGYIGHQMEEDDDDEQEETPRERSYNKKNPRRTSDVADDSEEEQETELDKEAQLHGLSDGKEAQAAWDLPIE